MQRKRSAKKTAKRIVLVISALIVTLFSVRASGRAINNKTPAGGINESMYIEVNGTKQWINLRE